jgi:hypothetical protein
MLLACGNADPVNATPTRATEEFLNTLRDNTTGRSLLLAKPQSRGIFWVLQGDTTTYRSNEHMAERDRDEAGRHRNSRPRDAVGRLLALGSQGVLRIPDDLELSPSQSLAYAQDLLNEGLAFNAHEVLEAAWKNCPDNERPLWQGLAQLAVGIPRPARQPRRCDHSASARDRSPERGGASGAALRRR